MIGRKLSTNIPINEHLFKMTDKAMYLDSSAFFYGIVGCFTGNTLINTIDGYKKIKDIVVGDMVLSLNEKTGTTEYKNVTNRFKYLKGVIGLHRIKTQTTEIICTKNHKFLKNGKWIEARNLERYKLDSGNRGEIPNKLVRSSETQKIYEYSKRVQTGCEGSYLQGYEINNIKSIDEVDGEKFVYDIEVEDNHNYVITKENIIVHNSGKTQTMQSMALKYHDSQKMKLIDWWGGSRLENYQYCLPSQKTKYWNFIRNKLNLKESPAKAYKLRLLIPMWKGDDYNKIMKKIPFKQGIVDAKIFTLDVNKITPEILSSGYGKIAPQNSILWDRAKTKLNKDGSSPMFQYYLSSKGENLQFVQFVKKMSDNLLLQGSACPYNIDMEEEVDDVETITSICTEHIPKEYRLLVTNYCLEMARQYITRKKGKETIMMGREVSEMFRDVDGSTMQDNVKCFKNFIKSLIQLSRSGHYVMMDTQSPREVGGLLEGSESYKILCKLPERDIDFTLGVSDNSKVDARLRKLIPNLNKGQFVFVPRSGTASLRYIFMPRCHHWSSGDGRFYNDDGDWMKFENTWTKSQPVIDEIIEYSNRELEKAKRMTRKRNERKKVVDEDEDEFEDEEEDNEGDGMEKNDREEKERIGHDRELENLKNSNPIIQLSNQ